MKDKFMKLSLGYRIVIWYVLSFIIISGFEIGLCYFIDLSKLFSGFDVLTSDQALATQISITFIIISLISVFSNSGKKIYWEDVMNYKLVNPLFSNFTAISVYLFACLTISIIENVLRSACFYINFYISILIMMALTFKMLSAYFAGDSIYKELANIYKKSYQNRGENYIHYKSGILQNTLQAVKTNDIDMIIKNVELLNTFHEYEEIIKILLVMSNENPVWLSQVIPIINLDEKVNVCYKNIFFGMSTSPSKQNYLDLCFETLGEKLQNSILSEIKNHCVEDYYNNYSIGHEYYVLCLQLMSDAFQCGKMELGNKIANEFTFNMKGIVLSAIDNKSVYEYFRTLHYLKTHFDSDNQIEGIEMSIEDIPGYGIQSNDEDMSQLWQYSYSFVKFIYESLRITIIGRYYLDICGFHQEQNKLSKEMFSKSTTKVMEDWKEEIVKYFEANQSEFKVEDYLANSPSEFAENYIMSISSKNDEAWDSSLIKIDEMGYYEQW